MYLFNGLDAFLGDRCQMLTEARSRWVPFKALSTEKCSVRRARRLLGVVVRKKKTLGPCLVAGWLLAAVSGDCTAGESNSERVAQPQSSVEGSFAASKAAAQQSSSENSPEADENSTSTDLLCDTLVREAIAQDLPVAFFARLIWKESRLDPRALSPRGAKGIAQFMPKTAAARGLTDPYEPQEALTESAALLRDLWTQFGNVGLAAAAYNAGPKRVRAWLKGSASLPAETASYVLSITGLTAEHWSGALTRNNEEFPIVSTNPCSGLDFKIATDLPAVPLRKPPSPSLATTPHWGLQLIGDTSEDRALAAYRSLREKYSSILGNRPPLILLTRGARGSVQWVRIRVAESTRERATQLCSRLKAEGGSCLLVVN